MFSAQRQSGNINSEMARTPEQVFGKLKVGKTNGGG